jgi:NADP-dependent 3-hydroxy acid dehydrogenase YdfG
MSDEPGPESPAAPAGSPHPPDATDPPDALNPPASLNPPDSTNAPDLGPLAGGKVVVTGSSSGIGRALTELLLARGATVVGIARRHDKFEPGSSHYLPVTLDLSELDTAAGAFDALAREHPDVQAIVSNAGSGRIAELEQIAAAEIRRDIDLNLTSHLLVARAFLPGLKRRGGGDLLITGSTSGRRGARKGAVYCAAKFGLRGMAQALRRECARAGVRVTLLSPGPVRTPFFDSLDHEPGEGQAHALGAEDVARVMLQVLEAPSHVVFDEIELGPRHEVMRRR